MPEASKKKIKVYLAGSFAPFQSYLDWRNYVKERLGHAVDFYDPRKDTNQSSIAHFVYEDLEKGVVGSDLVFYFVTSVGDIGAAAECAFAVARGKFVVFCVDEKVKFVHPFLLGLGRRVFIGIDTGLLYLKKLAEYGPEKEFDAIYAAMKELG